MCGLKRKKKKKERPAHSSHARHGLGRVYVPASGTRAAHEVQDDRYDGAVMVLRVITEMPGLRQYCTRPIVRQRTVVP